MGYGPPAGLSAARTLRSGYTTPASSAVTRVLSTSEVRVRGAGYLAGSFPNGITTVEGVPVSAQVRVLLRMPSGDLGDGQVVAFTTSAADGTWNVSGLDPNLRYDVIARKAGQNDVIASNVAPAV